MKIANRMKLLKAAALVAVFALAVTFATATAFAETSAKDETAGQTLTTSSIEAADSGAETVDPTCVPGDALNGVKVRFRPAGSYKPVSVEDDGDGGQKDLILYYLGESTHFRLEKADGDSYKIRFFQDFAKQDVKKDKAQILDVERNNGDDSTYYRDGQNIHMVSGNEDAINKRWQFIQQPDGTYYIRNKMTQKYWSLEDLDEPRSNNNEVVQRSTPMKWELELVSTSDFSASKMAGIKNYDSLNFNFGGGTVTSLNWMSYLPDSAHITDISIPGTHDAATARLQTSEDKESRRTQQYYIDEMLAAGVRHFDTRLGWENHRLTLVHSSDADGLNHQGADLSLAEMLQWTIAFLEQNPGETVIMQIMADENEKKVETEALAYFNDFVRHDAYKDRIWVGNHVPTLGEVRGKIVIISRFNKVTKDDSSDFYVPERGGYWALDVGGWRQSDTYPAYQTNIGCPTIHSSAQPNGTANKWPDCEVWVQDSYSHTPHDTTFKNSKRPYIVGSIDGIVYDYFDLPEEYYDAPRYPEGTYGTEYRRAEALKNNKHAWVFNFTNCSANGLGYHYRGNAKEIHQWIYDNDWIIRDDMFAGVVAFDYVDELMANKVYRTNFAGGTGGWGKPTYEWSADNSSCTASRTWTGGAGFTETEVATVTQTVTNPTCTTRGSISYAATFENENFETQTKRADGESATGHRWNGSVITKLPTCTESGVKTFTCLNDSGHTKTEVVPAAGHTPAEPVRESAAQPGGKDNMVVYCGVCGAELLRQEVTEKTQGCKHAHQKTTDVTLLPASCTLAEKKSRVTQCEDCGETLSSEEVQGDPALGHLWGEATYTWADNHAALTAEHTCTRSGCGITETETVEPSVTTQEPTCEQAGQAVYTATFADKSFGTQGVVTDTVPIEALGHSWDTGVVTKWRTCTEDGMRVHTCLRCDSTEAEILPATGHSPDSPSIENETAPTCSSMGFYEAVVYCSSCEEEMSRTEGTLDIDPDAHKWEISEGCNEDGWKAYTTGNTVIESRTCALCGATEQRSYDTGHTMHDSLSTVPEQLATCVHAGVKEHVVCNTCGHVFELNDDGSLKETTLAALVIPSAKTPRAHVPGSPEHITIIEPTCETDGEYEKVVHCEACGQMLPDLSREHVTEPALGHDWGEAVYAWSGGNSFCTATRTCKHDSSHVQSETGSVSIEVTKEPSATAPGVRTYTATFAADWAQAQTVTSEIAPTGSDEVAYRVTKGGGSWTKGSSNSLTFTFKRSQQDDLTFSLFTAVLVDGKEIPASSYNARAGSVVIELLPAYLETLAVGAHTLQPTFEDGVGEKIAFTVAAAPKPDDKGGSSDPGGNSDKSGGGNEGDKSGGGENANANANDDGSNANSALGGSDAGTRAVAATSKGSSSSPKTGDAVPLAVPIIVGIVALVAVVVALVARKRTRR